MWLKIETDRTENTENESNSEPSKTNRTKSKPRCIVSALVSIMFTIIFSLNDLDLCPLTLTFNTTLSQQNLIPSIMHFVEIISSGTIIGLFQILFLILSFFLFWIFQHVNSHIKLERVRCKNLATVANFFKGHTGMWNQFHHHYYIIHSHHI